MNYKKRFIRNDLATSENFGKNKKLLFKIAGKIRNYYSKLRKKYETALVMKKDFRNVQG